jgi:hypothetical protein
MFWKNAEFLKDLLGKKSMDFDPEEFLTSVDYFKNIAQFAAMMCMFKNLQDDFKAGKFEGDEKMLGMVKFFAKIMQENQENGVLWVHQISHAILDAFVHVAESADKLHEMWENEQDKSTMSEFARRSQQALDTEKLKKLILAVNFDQIGNV